MTDFTELPDLAARNLGGGVVAANDEFFAERENLIKPEPAVFTPHTFGHKGQVYDGWETRRRRDHGHDWATVRLGTPGVIRGVVVDTAFFTGNYPEACSVEAASVAGYPSPEELAAADWVEVVPRSPLAGDTRNVFAATSGQRFTHVRLNIFPDGGVARLRVHGEVLPDPRWFAGIPLDLAALQNGGVVTDCSNRFYSAPNNLLLPGQARVMGEGWETARRRGGGNDWVNVRLVEEGIVRQVEIDTTHFKGNAPGWFRLTGDGGTELLPRTRLQPDTRHVYRVPPTAPVREIRVDVYPDGGFARLRVYGDLTAGGRERVGLRWYDALPATRAAAVLTEDAGLAQAAALRVAAARPLLDGAGVERALAAAGVDDDTAIAVRTLLTGR
ncbi:allantoicase [Actinomadura vinacea]|uniref:Probable allantoicase n=1 Tax=Actinomadura vinacea TaxID=115336 RepID=A0ABN3IHC3_9ACTN